MWGNNGETFCQIYPNNPKNTLLRYFPKFSQNPFVYRHHRPPTVVPVHF